MKSMMIFVSAALLSGSAAFANNNPRPMGSNESKGTTTARVQAPKTRADFAMKGFSVSGAYSNVGVLGDIKLRSKSTGFSTQSSAKSDKEVAMAGIMGRFSQVPLQGAGFDFNASLLKSQKHGKGEALDSEATWIRTEGNIVLSGQVGQNSSIYGLGGLNLAHLTVANSSESIDPLGIGLQIGVGAAFNQNFNFELVYAGTRHRVAKKLRDNFDRNGIEVVDDESGFTFRGMMARLTYSF